MSRITKLKGLVTLVTGGASGLGRGTVERFVREGAKVAICDLPKSNGKHLEEQLGENVVFIPTDVTSADDVKNAIEIITNKFGSLNVAVNCAGHAMAAVIFNKNKNRVHSHEDFMKILQVNVGGTFNVTGLAAQAMSNNEPLENGQRGVIINTSGIMAFDGQKGQSAFAASSAAIAGMTLPLARDLGSYGVRVVSIAPGLFNTALTSDLPDKVKDHMSANIPFPSRLGEPDEFAQLAQTIVENPLLNGTTIRLDAGLRMLF